jgi:hypothetical protein
MCRTLAALNFVRAALPSHRNGADRGTSVRIACQSSVVVDGMTPKERAGFERFLRWRTRPRQYTGDTSDPSPQEVYAEWMKSAFGPALRAEGMRGSGGRFELSSGAVWAQLGFQKSWYSDSQEVRFTVNLSVIGRGVWDEQRTARPHLGAKPSPNFHYGEWADQVRIGVLTPQGDDKWWRIVRGEHSATVRDDAIHDLVTYGVPWLRQHLD